MGIALRSIRMFHRRNKARNINTLETQGLKGAISNTIDFEPDDLLSIGLAEELLFMIS